MSLFSLDINGPKKPKIKQIIYPFNRFKNDDIQGTKP